MGPALALIIGFVFLSAVSDRRVLSGSYLAVAMLFAVGSYALVFGIVTSVAALLDPSSEFWLAFSWFGLAVGALLLVIAIFVGVRRKVAPSSRWKLVMASYPLVVCAILLALERSGRNFGW